MMTREKQSHVHQPSQAFWTFTTLYSHRRGILTTAILLFILLSYHRYASELSMYVAEPFTELSHHCPHKDAPPASTIFLPYVHPFTTASVPLVKTTIGDVDIEGVNIDMPIDTGSTGVLIGAPLLPTLDRKEGTPTYHFLTSSKILYNGRLVNLTVQFHGSNGSYAKARVPVFVVDKSWICPWYDPKVHTLECPTGPDGEEATLRDTSQITYMGVGFGRNKPGNGQPGAVPKANPFLNIESINGRAFRCGSGRAGWTISTKGVHIGLTNRNTRGFRFTKLARGVTYEEDTRDWAMPKMSFSVDGRWATPGHGLVDTGVAQMYIRAEGNFPIPVVKVKDPNRHGSDKEVDRVRQGTNIAVQFPLLGGRAATYAFVVGEEGPMTPSFVAPGKQTPPPFLNTGRAFLHGYSIAFDAVRGRFGFRPTSNSKLTAAGRR